MPVEPFLASRHGFAFRNSWPSQPAVVVPTPLGPVEIGNARGGLCGGMVFAALDYWHAGTQPPDDQPAAGSDLYRYIVRRLVESWHVPAGILQYYRWMTLPDGDRSFEVLGRRIVSERGLSWLTLRRQWPEIRVDLDHGVPVALGVVTTASSNPKDLGLNHQVLAYGYEESVQQVVLHVYDPNRGRRDDTTISFGTASPTRPRAFTHTLGLSHPVRGFFRTVYVPESPPSP